MVGLGNATGTLIAFLYVLKKVSDTNERIDKLQKHFNAITTLLGGGDAQLFTQVKDKVFNEIDADMIKYSDKFRKIGSSMNELRNDGLDMRDSLQDLIKILSEAKLEKIPEKDLENLARRLDEVPAPRISPRRDNRRTGRDDRDNRRDDPRDNRRPSRREDPRREDPRDNRRPSRREDPRREDPRDNRRPSRREDPRDNRRPTRREEPRETGRPGDDYGSDYGSDENPGDDMFDP